MDDIRSYVRKLDETLILRLEKLEANTIPKLASECSLFYTNYQHLYDVFIKRGILQRDLYKNESRVEAITVPSLAKFNDPERVPEMSLRLANLDNCLDYLANFCTLSVNLLSLPVLKKLHQLINYVDFTKIDMASDSLITRSFSTLLVSLRQNIDAASAQVLSHALAELNRLALIINDLLEPLFLYQKEKYKIELRAILRGITFNAQRVLAEKYRFTHVVQVKLATEFAQMAFYPDLLEEILLEDYSPQGPSLRQAILNKIGVERLENREKDESSTFIQILLEGIRLLISLHPQLTSIAERLRANSEVFNLGRDTFFNRLLRLFRALLQIKEKPFCYTLVYVNPSTNEKSTESVDFEQFMHKLKRFIAGLVGYDIPSGPAWKKLESSSEEQILKFFERYLYDMQSLNKRLLAFEDFFRTEVAEAVHQRIQGNKLELAALRSVLDLAIAKRDEYTNAASISRSAAPAVNEAVPSDQPLPQS